eukprot:SAG31_NODE_25448_length_461_cov_0.919890_1_plen_93_part_01
MGVVAASARCAHVQWQLQGVHLVVYWMSRYSALTIKYCTKCQNKKWTKLIKQGLLVLCFAFYLPSVGVQARQLVIVGDEKPVIVGSPCTKFSR